MTLRSIIEKNGGDSAISTEEAEAVAADAIKIADDEKVEYAIAGGLAMHIYGFTRQTKEVDFIAARRLPLDVIKPLSFGGESYNFESNGKTIAVDWIVRTDTAKQIYQAALAQAVKLPNGWKIVSPEWLVMLKYIAGRPKDVLDLQFLLQAKGLVDRRKIRQQLIDLVGEFAALGFLLGLQRYYDLVDSTQPNNGDENESYRRY